MKKYQINLNKSGSVQRTIDFLESYKRGLQDKAIRFKKELIAVGIQAAKSNAGEYGNCITFSSVALDAKVSFMQGEDNTLIVKEWYTNKDDALKHENARSCEISPLYMAEFGSSFLAQVLWSIGGVGQGTMPYQRNAFDSQGWFWYDDDGIKHHSKGESPTFPMHRANLAMLAEADRIARKVFR